MNTSFLKIKPDYSKPEIQVEETQEQEYQGWSFFFLSSTILSHQTDIQ